MRRWLAFAERNNGPGVHDRVGVRATVDRKHRAVKGIHRGLVLAGGSTVLEFSLRPLRHGNLQAHKDNPPG